MSASRSSRPEAAAGSRSGSAFGSPSPTAAGGYDSPGAECRGQTEPIAALVALLAVGIGLALYAGTAADATPEPERSVAEPAMERFASAAVTDGTLYLSAIPRPSELAPSSQNVAVTLRYDGGERRVGPAAPPGADRATRSVSVRVAPGDRRPGRVVVEVWS